MPNKNKNQHKGNAERRARLWQEIPINKKAKYYYTKNQKEEKENETKPS